MGLDIVVYRSKESLGIDVDSLGAIKDPLTGEYRFPMQFVGDKFPRELIVAARWRVGNMDAVAQLRGELELVVGPGRLLLIEKCLYDGTHSGDTIDSGLFGRLDDEIYEIQRRFGEQFSHNLKDFLTRMLEVIQVAKNENNPIVFV
jgi:hypothetical protein